MIRQSLNPPKSAKVRCLYTWGADRGRTQAKWPNTQRFGVSVLDPHLAREQLCWSYTLNRTL